MKITEQWLREWVNPSLTLAEIIERLTMAGLEISIDQHLTADFTGVIVAEVVGVAPHPKSDRLKVCDVNIGEEDELEIVTNVTTLQPMQKVALALPGAILPGKGDIHETSIQGVLSQGVFCSLNDLGMGENANELFILPPNVALGEDIHRVLGLNDTILDVELTPNRGDCLSIMGLARELAALTQTPLKHLPTPVVPVEKAANFSIHLDAPSACPRYHAAIIRGINTRAHTPLWMQERLRRSGLRTVHPVVDVTNYVMLELGQPLHAFNLNAIAGNTIHVRFAKPQESITLLDGRVYACTEQDLVIADGERALALAGIMGGQGSAVDAETTNILLESAYFDPTTIAYAVRRSQLTTDAAQRFERGVDSTLAERALKRAVELLLDIVGGTWGGWISAESAKDVPVTPPITLRASRLEALLGMKIPAETVERAFTALGLIFKAHPETWQVIVPSHRFDLSLEEDLIEEVIRWLGYDAIPMRLPHQTVNPAPSSESLVSVDHLRSILVNRGYAEVITYSFIAPKMAALFAEVAEGEANIQLTNPISADMSIMRPNLLASLVETLCYNVNRQQQRARLFELGRSYVLQGNTPVERPRLALLIAGSEFPEQWSRPAVNVDFFSLKADVEALLGATHSTSPLTYQATEYPGLHPYQTADILREGKKIGRIGALHPVLARQLELEALPVYLAELDTEALTHGVLPQYKALSKFPGTRRDLAFVMDATISAQKVMETVGKISNSMLQSVRVFDVYQGVGVPEGKKSLAIALELQHDDRTLNDDEVNAFITTIITKLSQELGALLR